jgi:F-type H+-transporting ATPase subunit b
MSCRAFTRHSRLLIDIARNRVIVFTNLQPHRRIGEIFIMHRRHWAGFLLAALACMLPALAWAATEGGHGGGGMISLDKSLIVQVVNFVILLLILHRLLYKPLLAKMEERTAAIKTSLDEAQAARAEAARQQEQNAEQLRAAYAEAAAIRAAALKEAADEQRKLVEQATREAKQLVDTARAQTDADIRRAREELRREVSEIATSVAEKLVRRSLRDEDHRRIVDDAIARIGR